MSNLEEAIRKYGLICAKQSPQVHAVPDQQVQVAIFEGAGHGGSGRIELVAPTSPDSGVARFIAKHGEGLHHICVYVDDIRTKLMDLKAAGVQLIDETPRVGAEGHLIAFVHPADMNGVLIELEQRI